jgi:hypothetical protein
MGTVVSGSFTGINWGKNAKFLQVELNTTGGTSYTDLGTTQMMSVPYALYAGNSNSSSKAINSPKNRIGFDQNSIWKCPEGVSQIEVQLWSSGGGGGGILSWDGYGGIGGIGGKGGYVKAVLTVVPQVEYSINIGIGGNPGLYMVNNWVPLSSLNGTDGGSSSFGNLLSIQGGTGGTGTARGAGGAILQTGVNGQDAPIINYSSNKLSERTYIPIYYTNIYPLSFASGGKAGAWYYVSYGTGPTGGESGFCVIEY